MRIGLVAGEVSGDLLGAGLIEALAARVPGATFEGVGGERMRAAGMQCWHDADELAVMGLTEVLSHLPRLLKLRRSLVQRWKANPPDVFIGIDAPDFTLGLELKLRRIGIPTVHYVSPSVWAWREGRVKKIARACDRVLCLLPFEPAFYARHQVAADFVGHPLGEVIDSEHDIGAARDALGIDRQRPVLALLPGSRRGEITKLGRDFALAGVELRKQRPDLQVVVPLANSAGALAFQSIAEEVGLTDQVTTTIGNARVCMQAADVLVMASGTATLEGLLFGKPMVVGYRVAPSTYRLVKALGLMKIDYFSLPNLLTETPLVTELIQHDLTPDALVREVNDLFDNAARREAMRRAFAEVGKALRQDANELAADAVLATVGK
ncbi:MAG: lipid-A-disaccharide synthase [Pseudomonadota bacterium]